MINSIVFDMDGVLFDSERIYFQAWHQAGQKLTLPDMDECIMYCVGRNGSDIRDYLLSRYGQQFPVDDFVEDVRAEFSNIISVEGLPIKQGVREILEWLSGRQWKIALATSSGRKSAERNLTISGLLPYFQTIVTGDMIRHGKPDPEIYQFACSKLGSPPEDCFAVEDSPNGIKSAHAAGLKVIMIPDMIAPTPELEELLYSKFTSLLDARAYFESFFR